MDEELTTRWIQHLLVSAYALNVQAERSTKSLFQSQYQQDQYIYEHCFQGRQEGVFVDIGAHDGITFSNSYFFEQIMGWTGVCIEPIPELYEKLKKNRDCLCIQGCIFSDREDVAFLKVSGYAEMLSGIIENYDPQHVARIQHEIRQHGGHSEVIHVRCYDLTQLLLANQIKHVDYLSIDTEGGELDILRSIDFTAIDIDVIDVENNYNGPFQAFLEPLGYQKIGHLGCDEIYRKQL